MFRSHDRKDLWQYAVNRSDHDEYASGIQGIFYFLTYVLNQNMCVYFIKTYDTIQV